MEKKLFLKLIKYVYIYFFNLVIELNYFRVCLQLFEPGPIRFHHRRATNSAQLLLSLHLVQIPEHSQKCFERIQCQSSS